MNSPLSCSISVFCPLKGNVIEKRKVFSRGFRIFDVENKYDISILAKSIPNPTPNVKNLLNLF